MGTAQNQYPITPDLDTWVKVMFANLSANLNCHTIGTIYSFNPLNQTATISINYKRVVFNANSNPTSLASTTIGALTNLQSDYPLLIQCPIVIMQGGGAYLTFPIAKGDSCIVFFNDREISTWLKTGAVNAPQNQRVHDLSDGIALVGIRNLLPNSPIPNYSTTISVLSDQTGNRLAQSGMMVAYAGSTAPSGWLLCQGQSVAKATYPLLFAVIGYTYGGSGNNFNLPNMQGQVAAGIGGILALTLGQQFGEVTHQLTVSELATHNHGIKTSPFYAQGNDYITQNGTNSEFIAENTEDAGSNTPHNNVQPSLGVNWIIKI